MDPPNPAPIDMRHTKLKAAEAALLAGELVKPIWASRNEGIHERVSFEDTLWGFEMAGGAYYKTPLRVAYVRPGSRAEHACIRMGDTVLRINGQDTSNLTLQEAHKLVLEAGINLKIAVTSPDDKVNAHYDYEDPLNESPALTPEQLKEMELERVRKALERASRCRDLPWPWVRRKWTIYRESNCFMVPSKYENKHRDQFPELPAQKLDYFFPTEKNKSGKNVKENTKPTKNDEVKEKLEEQEEKFEEVEEEIEEEEVEEVEEEIEEEEEVKEEEEAEIEKEEFSTEQEGSGRLENRNNENYDNDGSEPNDLNLIEEENSASKLNNVENSNDTILENNQRKDSDEGSVSNYELDNNNNHIAKSKDEPINEAIQPESNFNNKIINEVVENSSELANVKENATKSDDEILDSVLNVNTESKDSENER